MERVIEMMYRNILIPYDGSDSAKHALITAAKIVDGDKNAVLHVFYVVDAPNFGDPEFADAAREAGVAYPAKIDADMIRRKFLAHKLVETKEEGAAVLGKISATVTYALGHGKPSEAIIAFCERNSCDLICMGCRGIGALRGVLGSVSYAVLRNSEVPVLVDK